MPDDEQEKDVPKTPWRIAEGPPIAVHDDSDVNSLTSGPGGTVYAVEGGDAKQVASYTRTMDVARLIAAAPDLLQACKMLLSTRLETNMPVGIRNEIKEAVAKAEGDA